MLLLLLLLLPPAGSSSSFLSNPGQAVIKFSNWIPLLSGGERERERQEILNCLSVCPSQIWKWCWIHILEAAARECHIHMFVCCCSREERIYFVYVRTYESTCMSLLCACMHACVDYSLKRAILYVVLVVRLSWVQRYAAGGTKEEEKYSMQIWFGDKNMRKLGMFENFLLSSLPSRVSVEGKPQVFGFFLASSLEYCSFNLEAFNQSMWFVRWISFSLSLRVFISFGTGLHV